MDKLDIKDLNKVNGGKLSEGDLNLPEGYTWNPDEDPLSGRERAKIITQEVVDKIKKEHDEELKKLQDPFGKRRDIM